MVTGYSNTDESKGNPSSFHEPFHQPRAHADGEATQAAFQRADELSHLKECRALRSLAGASENLRKNAQVEAHGGADSGDVPFVAGAVSPDLRTYCLS